MGNCPFVLLAVGKRRFNVKLWKTFTDCFNCLPIAAIIDEKIFCCHGGRSVCCLSFSLSAIPCLKLISFLGPGFARTSWQLISTHVHLHTNARTHVYTHTHTHTVSLRQHIHVYTQRHSWRHINTHFQAKMCLCLATPLKMRCIRYAKKSWLCYGQSQGRCVFV